MTDHGPDDMGDDEQETQLAGYEQYIEDPPDAGLVIAEDSDDDAEDAEDWIAAHPRRVEAEEEEDAEPDDESAEEAAIHEIPGT
jgi:hypothetical protein